jgi:twitching motility two-component system response regulator PilG
VAETKSLTGVRVMVIDDSNTIRRSAEIFLMQAGCQVILAENGFDALSKIADHQPDLIFVDIMMPRLDGYQTCALIKKSGKHRATPVIMLSSKDSLFDRARGRMVGSDEYLTKPFTKESLAHGGGVAPRPAQSRLMPNNQASRWRAEMAIKKIMVVDDSPTERAFMDGLLKKRGYEVLLVDSGEAAIERSRASSPTSS